MLIIFFGFIDDQSQSGHITILNTFDIHRDRSEIVIFLQHNQQKKVWARDP
jgi:hypothetical protein